MNSIKAAYQGRDSGISARAWCLLLFVGLIFAPGLIQCKRTPTTTQIEEPMKEPALSVSLNPTSAESDAIITVSVSITSSPQEIRVFGMEMKFDNKLFDFQKVEKSTLTGTWAAVDGNEIKAGTLRLGGFSGAGSAIAANISGTLLTVTFKVTGNGFGDGHQSQICINKYSDDISGIPPEPACTQFTFKK